MNKLDFWLFDDPREKALRDALYRAMARLGARPDRGNGAAGVREHAEAAIAATAAPALQGR
jgi:hypothetical protein